MLSSPSRQHQYLTGELFLRLKVLSGSIREDCEVYLSPFDVRLFKDDSAVVQPDLLVVCNRDILTEKTALVRRTWWSRLHQEATLPMTMCKLMLYQKAGSGNTGSLIHSGNRSWLLILKIRRKAGSTHMPTRCLPGVGRIEDPALWIGEVLAFSGCIMLILRLIVSLLKLEKLYVCSAKIC